MKTPKKAMLLLNRNTIYPIQVIHFADGLVTLKEGEKVYNTVSVEDVLFDYTGFKKREIEIFQDMFN